MYFFVFFPFPNNFLGFSLTRWSDLAIFKPYKQILLLCVSCLVWLTFYFILFKRKDLRAPVDFHPDPIDAGNQCKWREKRPNRSKTTVVLTNYAKLNKLCKCAAFTSGRKDVKMIKENINACLEKRGCKEINHLIQPSAFLYWMHEKDCRLIVLLGGKIWCSWSQFQSEKNCQCFTTKVKKKRKSYSSTCWFGSETFSTAGSEHTNFESFIEPLYPTDSIKAQQRCSILAWTSSMKRAFHSDSVYFLLKITPFLCVLASFFLNYPLDCSFYLLSLLIRWIKCDISGQEFLCVFIKQYFLYKYKTPTMEFLYSLSVSSSLFDIFCLLLTWNREKDKILA